MKSSRPVPSIVAGDRSVRFWQRAEGISVDINDRDTQMSRGATVDPALLAEALNEIPGFTVKYVKPIAVPQYLGAVVERQDARWVRVQRRSESSYGWARSGVPSVTLDDDDIASILVNGGYEVEPEFPTRTP